MGRPKKEQVEQIEDMAGQIEEGIEDVGENSIVEFTSFGSDIFDLIGGGRSLIPFVDSGVVNITIMLLIILGGLGFTVIFDVVAKRSFRKLNLHSKIVITLSFVLIAISFVLFLTYCRLRPLSASAIFTNITSDWSTKAIAAPLLRKAAMIRSLVTIGTYCKAKPF